MTRLVITESLTSCRSCSAHTKGQRDPRLSSRYSPIATERLFFEAEDGIRGYKVTGFQTCALPISITQAASISPGFRASRPHAGAAALVAAGEIDAACVIGSAASVPEPLVGGLARLPSVAIGPRASAASFRPAVAVDTGVAGIHDGGTAFRMDGIPLPLRPPLARPPTAAGTLRSPRERLR